MRHSGSSVWIATGRTLRRLATLSLGALVAVSLASSARADVASAAPTPSAWKKVAGGASVDHRRDVQSASTTLRKGLKHLKVDVDSGAVRPGDAAAHMAALTAKLLERLDGAARVFTRALDDTVVLAAIESGLLPDEARLGTNGYLDRLLGRASRQRGRAVAAANKRLARLTSRLATHHHHGAVAMVRPPAPLHVSPDPMSTPTASPSPHRLGRLVADGGELAIGDGVLRVAGVGDQGAALEIAVEGPGAVVAPVTTWVGDVWFVSISGLTATHWSVALLQSGVPVDVASIYVPD